MSGIIEVIVSAGVVIVGACIATVLIFITATFIAGWMVGRENRDD
jgi:hypothetical protein